MTWQVGIPQRRTDPDPTRRPYAIGLAYESSLGEADRRSGAHYTPPSVAYVVAGLAIERWRGHGVPAVHDPACGGGALLVAAADRLVELGADATAVFARLSGADLDPGAVAATRHALASWAREHGVGRDVAAGPAVAVGDALAVDGGRTPDARCDIVVANPPFQSQLAAGTARSAEDRSLLAARFGGAAKGYVDTAAVMWLAAFERVRAGGVVAMILPRSVLGVSSAAAVRLAAITAGTLESIWIPGVRLFAADVDVCVPVIRTAGDAGGGRRCAEPGRPEPVVMAGSTAERVVGRVRLPSDGGAWSAALAAANGVPPVGSPGATRLGSCASATAGFRDEFYAVARNAREATVAETDAAIAAGAWADPPADAEATARADAEATARSDASAFLPAARSMPIATTAMIDPGRVAFGAAEVRLGGARRRTPVVDLANLNGRPLRWVESLARPKVLVATQTRVIEAAPDPTGCFVALTPLVAVLPTEGTDLRLLTAALLAPPASAWAATHLGGSARTGDAIKLSARQILELPVPVDAAAWRGAAELLASRRVDWERFARVATDAWRLDSAGQAAAVVEWWLPRLEWALRRR